MASRIKGITVEIGGDRNTGKPFRYPFASDCDMSDFACGFYEILYKEILQDIRLPDFVTEKDFAWAVETASKKKKLDCSAAEFLTVEEGLCVQIMHLGPFDDEPATVSIMNSYLSENGYVNDINDTRLHHEIYMSDARKVAPEKWKTVIRHPIKKA